MVTKGETDYGQKGERMRSVTALWAVSTYAQHWHPDGTRFERARSTATKKKVNHFFFVCDAEIVLFIVIFFVRKQVFIDRRRAAVVEVQMFRSKSELEKYADRLHSS